MRTIPILFALLLVGCATTNEGPVRSARLITRCATPDLCSPVDTPEEMAPEVQTIGGKGKGLEANEHVAPPGGDDCDLPRAHADSTAPPASPPGQRPLLRAGAASGCRGAPEARGAS